MVYGTISLSGFIFYAFPYVFAPLVCPVRRPVLVDSENQGSRVALLHGDLLTSVGAHQGSGHQGETTGNCAVRYYVSAPDKEYY